MMSSKGGALIIEHGGICVSPLNCKRLKKGVVLLQNLVDVTQSVKLLYLLGLLSNGNGRSLDCKLRFPGVSESIS